MYKNILFAKKRACKRLMCAVVLCLYLFSRVSSQSYEDQYRQPLDTVLKMIETRFHVKLRYNDNVVKDKMVTFAGWRFTTDLVTTLNGILSLHDLVYYKANDTLYNIEPYAYWQKPVEEGKEQLDSLWASYKTLQQWEKRKSDLRKCILATLGLDKLPVAPGSKPIITNKRRLNGYSVENIAIETLPGLFVCGSIYRPLKSKGKLPVILTPNGHFAGGRYRSDEQYRCAMLAKMGAMVFSYDLFGWGESRLQFQESDHYTSTAMVVQELNNFRILDYVTSLKETDTQRIAITGASGGGSQTMLMTALSDKIKVSVPVVMLSCYYSGGCPCETGLPIHFCGNGTNNAEIAAMAAPRSQLVISDGSDWTDHVPQIEFPYLQNVYGLYDKASNVKNVHFPTEAHNYGFLKRKAMYEFLAEHLHLSMGQVKNKSGEIDESSCKIEDEKELLVFGKNGEGLPAKAIKGIDNLKKIINTSLR